MIPSAIALTKRIKNKTGHRLRHGMAKFSKHANDFRLPAYPCDAIAQHVVVAPIISLYTAQPYMVCFFVTFLNIHFIKSYDVSHQPTIIWTCSITNAWTPSNHMCFDILLAFKFAHQHNVLTIHWAIETPMEYNHAHKTWNLIITQNYERRTHETCKPQRMSTHVQQSVVYDPVFMVRDYV